MPVKWMGRGLEAVVHPIALLAGAEQANLLESLELDRLLGSGQIQVDGEVNDALSMILSTEDGA
jgi:hypothetical protein